MSNSTAGMYQFVPTADTLVATTEQAVLAAINTYAGAEIAANDEHIAEAFQMLKVKTIYGAQLPEGSIAYYYYFDDNNNAFLVIAGPAGMNAANQIQPKHGRLQLVLDIYGNIIGAGECYDTSLAFPPAAPNTPVFS